MKTLRDPIHGDISLTDLEIEIMDTPEFQRLRGIRQLGTSHLIFPGANHTRFEHSVGTNWMLKRMIRSINRSGMCQSISDEERNFLGVAALLHDITHIPFGHTFEDERRILPAHDKSTDRLIHFMTCGKMGNLLKKKALSKKLIRFFTSQKSKQSYAYDLVAGPICSDLLDYLRRDAYFCGLPLNYDDRILKYLSIQDGRLCFELYNERGFRQDAWSELISLLRIRFHLTERVYFHHAKMASGAMLSRILETLIREDLFKPEELYTLTDDGLMVLFNERLPATHPFRDLLDSFLSRKLYKRVYMVAKSPLNPDFPSQEKMLRFKEAFHLNRDNQRYKLEARIARALKIPAFSIIIYAPDTDMRLKEANIQVRVDAGPLRMLSELSNPELTSLQERHQALWRFFLFMAPRYESHFLRASKIMEKEIGLNNQLDLFNQGQLSFNF
jgi:HD superfamily phosphohydrolase